MWFTAITVAVGFGLGLALGGRPRHLPEHTFHLWPLLLGGLALQVLVETDLVPSLSLAMVIVSYALLLAFACLNLRLTGMGIVMVGMAMNALPIVLNGGMPVRASALAHADIAASEARANEVSLTGKRHLEQPDDRLTALGDIVPVRAIRQVMSFGDLVLAVGTVVLIVGLLRAPRRRLRHSEAY
jgi:hypothetical protein